MMQSEYLFLWQNDIQAVSKMRVLTLKRGRTCSMKCFFYLNLLRKSVTN
jgi:hypothetical protein